MTEDDKKYYKKRTEIAKKYVSKINEVFLPNEAVESEIEVVLEDMYKEIKPKEEK